MRVKPAYQQQKARKHSADSKIHGVHAPQLRNCLLGWGHHLLIISRWLGLVGIQSASIAKADTISSTA